MPGGLHIILGNRLEVLAEALADVIRNGATARAGDPLQAETVLVQSKGMQRWISMSLARHNGICANMAFPFPNAFLEETCTKVIGAPPPGHPFDPCWLTFRIMALLNAMADQNAFKPVRNYLAGQGSELKRYQLSRKIADLFDQYLVFRPDIIAQWEKGRESDPAPDHAWQAILWRRIKTEIDRPHRSDLQKELLRRLMDERVPIANLPARVSVFGISYLPVFHVQVLDALAHRIPVNLFLLNPCRQYWADIFSDHQMILARSKVSQLDADPADFHFERGNRLLSSWGQQGRQFFALTHHLEGQVSELFQDNDNRTLLEKIQQDILDLIDRPATAACQTQDLPADDRSIRVHVCHSPMREVEVLHDQLMDILEHDPDMHPGDILVMTPDIGHYAPFIHAVFGTSVESRENVIPYTVADQNLASDSRLVEGYLRLLWLPESRFEVSRVMEMLECEALRQRFGIDEHDLHQIEIWLQEANIRWGWDGEHRRRKGLPRSEANTWRTGLDRLIAGYAMQSDVDGLFAGILPHEGIEGSDVQVLEKLIHYVETLYRHISQIPADATLDRWAALLNGWIDTFFLADDPSSRDMQVLRRTIGQLKDIEDNIASGDPIGFEAVRQYLTDSLKQAAFGAGFMAGCVTFCAMLPMRSIPAKTICLLGLQHDAFPQESHEPGFSLIAGDPRPGDRSKRNDDKYLFLEALISARSIFYLSYIGRDIQDNSAKPPSVIVNELLEYIAQGFNVAVDDVVTVHPLQSFSRSYFNGQDSRLFSYSKEDWQALDQMRSHAGATRFFRHPLPPPEQAWYQCDLGQLDAFFSNPCRFLLEKRLGIKFRPPLSVLEDRENFNLDPLSYYQIGQSLLSATTKGHDARQHYLSATAGGEIPPGIPGQVVHDRIEDDLNRFLTTLNRFQTQDHRFHIDVDLDLQPFHIGGRIEGLGAQARLVYRFARLRPKDLLSAFIAHLCLQLQPQNQCPETTVLVCKDAIWKFGPLNAATAADTLRTYLSLFRDGLQMPLTFFSLTSFEYAYKRIVKNNDRADAIQSAIKTWRGGYKKAGEFEDAYIKLCFKDEEPLTPEFESLAMSIFSPLFGCGQLVNPGF